MRGSRDQEIDRGAPRGAPCGTHERSEIGVEGDILRHAYVEAAGGRVGPGVRLGKAARHGARGAVESERTLRPINAELAVDALRQEVVRRRHGDGEAGTSFGTVDAPPGVELGVVARLRCRSRTDDRLRCQSSPQAHVVTEPRGEGERWVILYEVRRARKHIEAVEEVELQDPGDGYPGAAVVRRPVEEARRT